MCRIWESPDTRTLQGDDLLLQLELVVLQIINLLLVQLFLFQTLQRGPFVSHPVKLARLSEFRRHLFVKQGFALFQHGQGLFFGREGRVYVWVRV